MSLRPRLVVGPLVNVQWHRLSSPCSEPQAKGSCVLLPVHDHQPGKEETPCKVYHLSNALSSPMLLVLHKSKHYCQKLLGVTITNPINFKLGFSKIAQRTYINKCWRQRTCPQVLQPIKIVSLTSQKGGSGSGHPHVCQSSCCAPVLLNLRNQTTKKYSKYPLSAIISTHMVKPS